MERRSTLVLMLGLPNFSEAILDERKLADYCLNPFHPRGRHKARVFRKVLGIGPEDASWLRQAMLSALEVSNALEVANDEHGVRWRVDIPVTRQERSAVIRTIWIVRTGERAPRFVTCWIE